MTVNRLDIYLREQAWDFIINNNINSLPVDSSALAYQLGYKTLPYTQYARSIGESLDSITKIYGHDGFTFWNRQDNKFYICYNDFLPPVVVRWTIMHEIAHIVLGHVTPDQPVLTRIRLMSHPLMEKEADGFTRRVLCPSIVLHNCGAIKAPEIMALCGISFQAAQHRSNYIKLLEQRNKWLSTPKERIVQQQFYLFMFRYIKDKFSMKFAAEYTA